jgi:hypothetical protein
MYVKIKNGSPIKYSISQLRKDNPQVSFPLNIPASLLTKYDVYPLKGVAHPEFDPITQNVVEGSPVFDQIKQEWKQSWEVIEASPEQVKERTSELIIEAKGKRQRAYEREADPLYFKAQRNEATLQEWLAKIDQIKNRYPYPEIYDAEEGNGEEEESDE